MKLQTGSCNNNIILVIIILLYLKCVQHSVRTFFFCYSSSFVAISEEINEQSGSTPLTLSPSKCLHDQNLSHNSPHTQHTASQLVECPCLSISDRYIYLINLNVIK